MWKVGVEGSREGRNNERWELRKAEDTSCGEQRGENLQRGKDGNPTWKTLGLLGDGACTWIPTIQFLVPPRDYFISCFLISFELV